VTSVYLYMLERFLSPTTIHVNILLIAVVVMATRRQPLRDLPLDPFFTHVPATSSMPVSSPFKSGTKRALDVNDVNPSPVKRRIRSSSSRKLEFEFVSVHKTPTRIPRTSNLLPSPELPSRSAKRVSIPSISLNDHGLEIDHCFSQPHPIHHSFHYPGFDVHKDTRPPSSRTPTLVQLQLEKDEHKENVPPRRKARKAITAPTPPGRDKSGLLSPCINPKAIPTTPKKRDVLDAGTSRGDEGTPTPRRKIRSEDNADLTKVMMSSPWMFSVKGERRESRRKMEEEEDAEDDEDEL
jgi:hypothetical protein